MIDARYAKDDRAKQLAEDLYAHSGDVAAVGLRIGLAAGFGASAYGGERYGLEPGAVPAPSDPSDAAYAGGGMTGAEYAATRR